jgi:ArsR family metal-binding transcriptional regulator
MLMCEEQKCIQYSVSLLQFHNIIKQCLTIMDPGGYAIRRGDDLILDLFLIM